MKKYLFTVIFIFLIEILLITLMLNCASPTRDDVSDVGKHQVIGYVYNKYGANSEPVENASVTFIISSASPDTVTGVSVLTDEYGCYKIAKESPLAPGVYNIFADKDSSKGYKKEALYIEDTESSDTIPPIMLSKTGSLTGVIRLQPPQADAEVTILLVGTHFYYRPDSNGVFNLNSLAPGDYAVHIRSEPFGYTPYDATFSIRSGTSDTLRDTIELLCDLIPAVNGLSIDYDTTVMTARLSWNRSNSSIVTGYNVYRAKKGMVLGKINEKIITDTFYLDDVIRYQDSGLLYAVVALDSNQNESKFSELAEMSVVASAETVDSVFIKEGIQFVWDLTYDINSDYLYGDLDYEIFRCYKNGSGVITLNIDSITNGIITNLSSLEVGDNKDIYLRGGHQITGGEAIVQLDPDFNIIFVKRLPDTEVGYNLEVSNEGEIFMHGHGDSEPKSRIKKYDASYNLINEFETDDHIQDIQIMDSKLILNIYSFNQQKYFAKWCDFDFTFLDSIDLGEFCIGVTNDSLWKSFTQGYNGCSVFQKGGTEYGTKTVIISSDKKILLRQFFRYDHFAMDTLMNLYQIRDGKLYTYRLRGL